MSLGHSPPREPSMPSTSMAAVCSVISRTTFPLAVEINSTFFKSYVLTSRRSDDGAPRERDCLPWAKRSEDALDFTVRWYFY